MAPFHSRPQLAIPASSSELIGIERAMPQLLSLLPIAMFRAPFRAAPAQHPFLVGRLSSRLRWNIDL